MRATLAAVPVAGPVQGRGQHPGPDPPAERRGVDVAVEQEPVRAGVRRRREEPGPRDQPLIVEAAQETLPGSPRISRNSGPVIRMLVAWSDSTASDRAANASTSSAVSSRTGNGMIAR